MQIKLGFGAIPKPQYVFVSREPDYCWYMLAEDEKRIPIYDKALTGVITGIEVNKKIETKFGAAEKNDLYILADKPYIIRSGSDSYFSKTLLLSLDVLTSEQLLKPLTVTVTPGDKTVVFCKIYDPFTYRSLGFIWDEHKEINWQVLAQKISLKLNLNYQPNHQESTEISANTTTDKIHEGFIAETDTYLAQLNWTPEQGKEYLQQTYGKRSRLQLTDTEIQEFIDYLKLQVTTK
ncbi:MAG: hypothetical protein MET45_01665 [Nostoc sp. LLA-1]|nr:hypothetical protein [Cyanocohniella sp. LLY]